jgi:hypothetical protein
VPLCTELLQGLLQVIIAWLTANVVRLLARQPPWTRRCGLLVAAWMMSMSEELLLPEEEQALSEELALREQLSPGAPEPPYLAWDRPAFPPADSAPAEARVGVPGARRAPVGALKTARRGAAAGFW